MFYWWIWHPGNEWNDWEVKVFLGNDTKVFKFKGVEQVYDLSNLIQLKDQQILRQQISTIFDTDTSPVEIYSLLFEESNAAWWLQSTEYASRDGTGLENDLEQFGIFLSNCLDNGTQSCILAHRGSLQVGIDFNGASYAR